MELEKKQEEVAKLYALRGGLSVLSEIYDEASSAKKRIKQKEDEIQSCEEKISKEKRTVSEQIEEIDHKILKQNDVIKEHKNNLTNLDYKLEKNKKHIIKCSVFLIIYIFITIIGISYYLNLFDTFKVFDITFFFGIEIIYEKIFEILPAQLAYLVTWLASLLALPSPIVIIYLLFDIISTIKDDKKKLNNALCALNNEKNKLNSMKENRIKSIREINGYCDGKEKEQNSLIESHKSAIQKEESNIAEITKRFEKAHKAVQEQFGGFLDERDWGNVDLIIFNYETGRAIDMRDALMQVDNERRNQRLIKAVKDASHAISSSIKCGFGALQGALTEQFDMLDRRISGFSSQVERISQESSKQIAVQSAAMEAKLGQIAEISSAQTALINKMNVSSDKMANDIEDMRRLANYTYYGS